MYTIKERAEWIFEFGKIALELLARQHIEVVFTMSREENARLERKRNAIKSLQSELIYDFQECYALPDFRCMQDVIHPITGLTMSYQKSEADMVKQHPTILRMTVEAFCQKKAELQNAPVEWMPTDQATYYDRLEALPPEFMDGSRFLLGEPMDHCAKSGLPRFEGYYARNGRYFYTSRPVTVRDFKVLALP